MGGMILYLVLIVAVFWFFAIWPQRKERKKKEAMLAKLTVGDYVMTTTGMFGQVIDITSDMVIIEFGGSKNCRIPMLKNAVASIEKAETAAKGEISEDGKNAAE